MLGNTTRNQHFLPRVEQKLNALNPASRSQKFKIYSFRLINRETYEIALENPRGRSIANTLFHDVAPEFFADKELYLLRNQTMRRIATSANSS